MSKGSSIKEYISKAKKIINDDEKLRKLIEDVLKKLKEISSDKNFIKAFIINNIPYK